MLETICFCAVIEINMQPWQVEPREKTKDAKNATAQDASDKKGLKATKDVSKDAKGMESKNDAIKKEALEMAKQELQGA